MSDRAASGASFLLLSDFERLEEWCRLVRVVFDDETPYLVGSVNDRPDFRDVDLRLILSDDVFDERFHDAVKLRLTNRAISTWGQRETGLPIDFQIQRQTDANAEFGGKFRNPMGMRDWRHITPRGVRDRRDVDVESDLHALTGCSPELADAIARKHHDGGAE